MNTVEHSSAIGFGYRYLARNNSDNGLTSGQAGELYKLEQQPSENDFSQPYWRTRLWKDVQEGDFILLRQDDIIPADILILSSSEQEPICYIETKNLDGETNLKIRRCVPGLGELRSPEDCVKRQFWVESEGPTNNLLKYNGAVVFPLHPENLDESTYLNKGAPFTTTDPTSHYHNPAYATFISFMMSVITFQNLVPVALYLTVEGVKTIQAYFIYQDQGLYYEERDIPCIPRSWNLSDDLGQIEYIFSDKTGTLTTNQMEFKKCSIHGHVFDYTAIPPAEPSVGHEAGGVNEGVAVHCEASNELTPSEGIMEVLKEEDDPAGQGNRCQDEEHTKSCLGRSPTLRRSNHPTVVNDNNSVARHAVQMQEDSQAEMNHNGDNHDDSDGMLRSRSSSNATAVQNDPTSDPQRTSTTIARGSHFQQPVLRNISTPIIKSTAFVLEAKSHLNVSTTDLNIARDLQKDKDYFFLNLSICHTVLVSATVTVSDSSGDISHANPSTSSSNPSSRQDNTQRLFPTPSDADYQAQSPDELALVIASKSLSYTFLGRQVDIVLMAHPQELEPRRYKVLHVLEFNSTRKRMSVIVRRQQPPRDSKSPTSKGDARQEDTDTYSKAQEEQDDDEELLLLTKGADNIIFERLAPGQQQLIHDTTMHLQDFAREGLRTLCLAYKVLDPATYHSWAERYYFASTFVEGTHTNNKDRSQLHDRSDTDPPLTLVHDNTSATSPQSKRDAEPSSFGAQTRQSMLEDLAEEIERDLQLLGATGIEDRLQDGVPETIRLIKRAGIKVWVLTGDKIETAISIGVSTGLLSHGCGDGSTSWCENDGTVPFINSTTETSKDSVSSQQEDVFHPSTATTDESSAKCADNMGGSNGWGGSHCPDMELILIRGDTEPLQSPECGDRVSCSSSEQSASSSNDSKQREHPVMRRIKNALQSFTASSENTDTAAKHDAVSGDSIADEEKSTQSNRDARSGFGYFVPWRTRVKKETPSFTRSIRNSVSSRRRSSTLIGKPMSDQTSQVRDGRNTALVIDGQALKYALEDPECKTLLLELACHCSSVICCRVSPLQKAMVVKMVKEAKKVMTLSIGDGANDVSMIQEAHIGIGVAGEEGLQAVMASDYSIGQFRFLARLLLVHGHYAYLRNTSMVMLFIYKNIIGIGVLFCYEFVCGFSSVPVFEYSYVLLYNVVLTVFPPLIIGIFDRDIGPGVLMTFPELYKVGLLQQEFTNTRFLVYSLEGTFQSILCFLIPYFAYQQGAVDSSGLVQEMYEMGLAMAVASIMQANIFAAVVSHSFCAFHIIFIWGSVVLIVVYSALYALMPRALSQWNPNYGFTFSVMGSLTFWAVVALTLLGCNIPRLTARFIRRTWWPSDLDILQEVCRRKLDLGIYAVFCSNSSKGL
ncbi:hypothetical protein BGZ68_009992 [Mortierella alpina]|nr:hypothetical protein BGZ68_009992 [Mortierella alpina]